MSIAREYNGRYLSARVDEVRISGVARSSNWLWAVHRNIASNGSFSSYGAAVNLFPNTAPALAAVSNRVAAAGRWLAITNAAADAEAPPQVLTFSLVAGPSNAALSAAGGVFTWRPAVAQAGTSHAVVVRVADDGDPPMSSTQGFEVAVPPVGTSALYAVGVSNGWLTLLAAGDGGLDYHLEASTNLSAWLPVSSTWSASPPFRLDVPVASEPPQRFHRLKLGP